MTAYNATPTAYLSDLLILRQQSGGIPKSYMAETVTVAMWCPSSYGDPTTAVATMSAALYVRLFPHGHHGPTIVDQVAP